MSYFVKILARKYLITCPNTYNHRSIRTYIRPLRIIKGEKLLFDIYVYYLPLCNQCVENRDRPVCPTDSTILTGEIEYSLI